LELYKSDDFEAVTGKGVKTRIGRSPQKFALVENRKLMEEEKIDYESLEGDLRVLKEKPKR